MERVTVRRYMRKFQAKLDGQDVIVLEVNMDKEKALVAVSPATKDEAAKLKVVALDSLDLSIQQLTQLRLGVRDDVN
jgi:hypothetical protein